MNSGCFTIPIGQPFLLTLARGVLARFGDNPLTLAKVEILLPNRRSCRAFADILLQESGKPSLLLPRIHAIGDTEEDELPATLSKPRRLLLASEKISAHMKDLPRAVTFAWAEKLCALQDECERYGVSLNELQHFFPEDVAAHREKLLSLLNVIADDAQTIEAARNQSLKQKAASLRATSHPIIAAGSLGTIPATANLLRAIMELPQGIIILPGLDTACEPDVPPTHPQHGLQRLLRHLSVDIKDVKNFSVISTPDLIQVRNPPSAAAREISHLRFEMTGRSEFIRHWMQPDFHPQPLTSPNKLMVIEADTDFQEAEAIAIALRETLETPGKTATLVTPDRRLARQVSALIKKWDITVDDSAGYKLSHTPLGSILLLILDAASEPQSPLALLPLLKHPLCGFSRSDARELEQQFFRRQRNPRGEFYASIQAALKPLAELLVLPRVPLKQLLATHINSLQQFSANPPRPESPQLESALAEIIAAAEDIYIEGREYASLFRQLFAHYNYRPVFGTHPRLTILSPMEARLMSADRIIVASLNDTAWPGNASEDWLGKRLRAQLGLPQHPDTIGHAAHDFCQLMGAAEIILTRARYAQGTPENPHPWLIRLQSLCTPQTTPYLDWIQNRTLPEASPLKPPAPCPPLAARPTTLSATDIRNLIQQPYRYYAEKILRLSPLDPLRSETADKDIGSAIHRAFEAYVVSAPWAEPQQALTKLLHDFVKPALMHPAEWVLWQARIPLIAAQFLEWDEEERVQYPYIHAEQKGSAKITIGSAVLEIHAKADRIAVNDSGAAIITDYKTGSVPDKKDIMTGKQPQLLIEKWILENAGYNTALSTSTTPHCAALQYWKMQSNESRAKKEDAPLPEASLLDNEIRSLLGLFYDRNLPFSAIPLDYKNNPDPYAHLMRVEEVFFR